MVRMARSELRKSNSIAGIKNGAIVKTAIAPYPRNWAN